MTGRRSAPTWTTLVLEALVRADDLMTAEQLRLALWAAGLKATSNRVSAALHHLHGHKAVDFVEADAHLWWFATPEDDTRLRVIQEKAPEFRPRRRRRKRHVDT